MKVIQGAEKSIDAYERQIQQKVRPIKPINFQKRALMHTKKQI